MQRSLTRRRGAPRVSGGTGSTATKPAGGKRKEAAEQALRDVLELFENDSLPAMIAQPVIVRQAGDEAPEGAELERPDYRPAEFPPLYDVAERLGVAVRYAPFVAKFRGRYQYDSRGREEIVLCSHDISTFFHELAHAAHRRVRGELQ